MTPATFLAAAGLWFAVVLAAFVATIPFLICLALAWAVVTGARRINRPRKERT
ncbi:hypothetical protein GCM10011583_18470 [Streptomyces camponoticapitis]|uniref:Uncharacterized protein n=1 Tax=Streptomyces camponoticapitis TaxID=1616125 RepID=A0ABQ2E285_9ACTN|nr:hypothetical protein [Streptomyces camponoticapitis]GGJ87236.1 hypothetical protein GCM10011583_18470 [Streptomyces camponoticapitis]